MSGALDGAHVSPGIAAGVAGGADVADVASVAGIDNVADVDNPCTHCGACCATFRVSFYWAEADDAPGGCVPVAVTEPLNAFLRCMRGTNNKAPRCASLSGDIPGARCEIYDHRSSTCREIEPLLADGRPDPKCQRARAAHGLAALLPAGCAQDAVHLLTR